MCETCRDKEVLKLAPICSSSISWIHLAQFLTRIQLGIPIIPSASPRMESTCLQPRPRLLLVLRTYCRHCAYRSMPDSTALRIILPLGERRVEIWRYLPFT